MVENTKNKASQRRKMTQNIINFLENKQSQFATQNARKKTIKKNAAPNNTKHVSFTRDCCWQLAS